MGAIRHVSRRDFLRATGMAGGGLVLGLYLPERAVRWLPVETAQATEPRSEFLPSVFLAITPDGLVTVWVSRTEMGQGVRTSLPMIVAEHLDVPWSAIRVRQADGDERYGHQLTGGSWSQRLMWEPLKNAGGTARHMLLEAASRAWSVPREELRTRSGHVVHDRSGREAGYGELVESAATVPVPELDEVRWREEGGERVLGSSVPHVDDPDIVTGRARYGLDTRVPGRLVAAVVHCPFFGGSLRGLDAEAARTLAGVKEIVEIPGSEDGQFYRPPGVAVVAEDTWTAFRGAGSLDIDWDPGPHAEASSDSLRLRLGERSRSPGAVVRDDGDVATALQGAATVVEAEYALPFLAHATMEPMNCVVDVRGDRCEVRSPTQNPQTVRRAVAQILEIEPENVTVHVTLLGGGFGRRLYPDLEMEGAFVSRAVGAPVQMVWTREEDFQHDRYRPASHHRLRGGLDSDGNVVAWHWHIVNTYEGRFIADDFPAFSVPNYRVEYTHEPWILPRGAWRATVHSQNPFVIQAFLDELAAAGVVDPLEMRLRMLRERPRPNSEDPRYDHTRMVRVLEEVGRRSGWGNAKPVGVGRGVAFLYGYDSYIAQVAEVRDIGGQPHVDRVVCVLDCGRLVHPGLVRAQVEGGITFGLSAALLEQVAVRKGRVAIGNFDDYPILTADKAPAVEVHLLESTADPTGVGETPLPPVAAAVANAWFDLSGQRLRTQPLLHASG